MIFFVNPVIRISTCSSKAFAHCTKVHVSSKDMISEPPAKPHIQVLIGDSFQPLYRMDCIQDLVHFSLDAGVS